jgi:hypothetical protein
MVQRLALDRWSQVTPLPAIPLLTQANAAGSWPNLCPSACAMTLHGLPIAVCSEWITVFLEQALRVCTAPYQKSVCVEECGCPSPIGFRFCAIVSRYGKLCRRNLRCIATRERARLMVASYLARRSQVSKFYLADPNRTHCAAPLSWIHRTAATPEWERFNGSPCIHVFPALVPHRSGDVTREPAARALRCEQD